MAKNKKSKILAMALCASVMTGIYASPVMAKDLSVDVGNGNNELSTSIHIDMPVGPDIDIPVLPVTGTLTIAGSDIATALTDTNLTLNSVTANTISTIGNTVVGGTLTAGATTVDSLTVKGGLTVTGGDTVIDGGRLHANKGLTVSSHGILIEEGGDLSLADGNVDVGGTLNVNGETTLKKTTVNGTLTAGATDVDSLTVNTDKFVVDADGNTTVGGTLNVTGESTLKGGLTVIGNTETDTLNVNGAAKVDSLEVVNSATVGDKLTVGNGLDVTGNALLNNDLTVNGATKLNGDVTVGGEAKFNEKATFNGKAIFNENIDVNGFANLNSGAKVNGELTVNGATKVNDDLTVNGDALVNGSLDISNGKFKVDADGNTEFIGNLNIGHGAFEVTAADGSFSAARDKFNVFADGSFNAASENFKVSADGVINADSLYLQTYGDGTLEVGEALQALTDAKLPGKVEGIDRDPVDGSVPNGEGVTTIEGMAKFDREGMTIGDTVVNDGVITVGAADNQTVIEGGAIIAKSLLLDGKDVGETIAGIEGDPEGGVTTIEGVTSFDATGMSIKGADGLRTSFTAGGATFVGESGTTTINGGAIKTNTINGVDFSDWNKKVNNRLDKLEYKTQYINGPEGTTAGGEGGTAAIDVPATGEGHTGINGDVTVGGEINAGEIVVGDKDSDNKTTINGGNITTGDTTIDGDGIKTGNGKFTGEVTVGDGTTSTTITGEGITTGKGTFTGNVDVDGNVTVGNDTTITGEGITTGTGTFDGVIIGEKTTIDSDGIKTNDITADTGTIGNVDMGDTGITVGDGTTITTITEDTVTTDNIKADGGKFDSQVTVGDDTTITNGNINLGGDNGTNINADGMTVGGGTDIKDGNITVKGNEGKVEIGKGDVAIFDENGEKVTSIQHNYDEINRVEEKFDGEVNRLDNRINKVEDRIDKVGAMSAAIANLRTMGYDPAAPTEIAVGVGQYRSETGVALGMFHYPNKDFMLSLSVSTSGDEVMGGIGATWKFGRKSPEKVLAAEKEKAAKAKLAKAEAMKKAAKEAKIKAQQERHAKLAAERAAQAEAAK